MLKLFHTLLQEPNVAAIRFRKKKQTLSNSAVTHHSNHSSVSAGNPSASKPLPPLPSELSLEHPVPPRSEPLVQISTPGVSDKLQLGLSIVQGITGLIPVAGGPLNSAINGLLAILRTKDTDTQSKAAIESLRVRLRRLSELVNTRKAECALEESRRDEFIRVLEETSDQLKKMDERFLGYQSVVQAISGCSAELDRYIEEIQLATGIRTYDEVVELRAIIQQFMGLAAVDLHGTVPLRCVILADVAGREHRIPMDFCTSFEQLNNMLGVLFTPNSIMNRIQRKFIKHGEYDLCIDQGTQVTELTSKGDELSKIEAGTKIVTRAVTWNDRVLESGLKCDVCGCADFLVKSARVVETEYWTFGCERCHQQNHISISTSWKSARNGTSVGGQITESKMMPVVQKAERSMNMLVRVVRDFVLRAAHIMLIESLPPPALRSEKESEK